MQKKRIVLGGVVFITVFLMLFVLDYMPKKYIVFDLEYSQDDNCQIYYADNIENIGDYNSEIVSIESGKKSKVRVEWKSYDKILRIDLGSCYQQVKLSDLRVEGIHSVKGTYHEVGNVLGSNEIKYEYSEAGEILIENMGSDPYIYFDLTEVLNTLDQKVKLMMSLLNVMIAVGIGICVYFQYAHMKILIFWTLDILKNARLILDLAISDFKSRYASSYLGMIWAFVQPVVSVLIYVIVFGYGFKSTPIKDFPFVLWLVAGIVPWFYFSDALTMATNSLREYSYLVKKVVFEIKILPLVKIVAAAIVHLFFVLVAVILYISNGYMPTVFYFQIIYYMVCATVLALGISYLTSALNVFVPDLSQVINIGLQFGMWMTPIMWNSDMFGNRIERIIKFNPLFYIVEGYRDCFFNKILFWDKPGLTLYFWTFSILCLILGMYTFRKLEKHFADVL